MVKQQMQDTWNLQMQKGTHKDSVMNDLPLPSVYRSLSTELAQPIKDHINLSNPIQPIKDSIDLSTPMSALALATPHQIDNDTSFVYAKDSISDTNSESNKSVSQLISTQENLIQSLECNSSLDEPFQSGQTEAHDLAYNKLHTTDIPTSRSILADGAFIFSNSDHEDANQVDTNQSSEVQHVDPLPLVTGDATNKGMTYMFIWKLFRSFERAQET
ncbi:hypothetical protein RFI_10418 [Reticulomyxa filosa]|uniref:Uncharacterized protein n=1 Tax=Reticulomyxa filosa TaxID=46433 RepID=X6NMU0_RETFI|nr:hypothetical protein RFI_10418 [Reticulomyxa filosa]|eukprot:ETO26717.1 hypothetical protein RFI_10418 [Reticulomyxa filosa]